MIHQLKKDLLRFLENNRVTDWKERDRLLEIMQKEVGYFHINELHREDIASLFYDRDDKSIKTILENECYKIFSDSDMKDICDRIGDWYSECFWDGLNDALHNHYKEKYDYLEQMANNIKTDKDD